ncbi:STAS domain-containing protein [Amycolatopsis sp. NPDC059090]|uniref:STAS domain-containing protein n=1 Tax=unclassified Amycolatopsis TaxID=2618356 RepID=UPI00366AFCC5
MAEQQEDGARRPGDAPDPAGEPLMAPFRVIRGDRDGAAVLRVEGDVDLTTVPGLTAAIAEVVVVRPWVFVLDLTRVTFLASVGLSALVIAQRDTADQTELRVVATGRGALRPIQLTGLDGVLRLYSTLGAALEGSLG